MVYTVTFNPSLDYRIELSNLNIGMVNRTNQEMLFPGGKGINVSQVLMNLGVESIALGFSGGFTGAALQGMLEKTGVKTDFIQVANGDTRINVKLKAEEETEINGKGPIISEGEIAKLYQKLDQMETGSILVLAGSIPASMPASIYMDIMEYLKTNHAEKEIKVIVDATGDLLLKVLPYQPFLIKPNNHELGEIYGVTLSSREDVIPYAKKLQEQGARNVLVSLAGEGAVLLTEEGEVYQAKAPKGEVVNSVGAGDSMVAGFIEGYLASSDKKYAFAKAVCTGSASAFSLELAKKEEVESLYRNSFGFV